MTRREREAAAYRARIERDRATRESKPARRKRRDDALYRHAKLVYDYDRDFSHEFSNE